MDVRPVVLHQSEVVPEVWDDPRAGRLSFRTLFSADRTPTTALTTGVAVLAPGDWLGRHRHAPPEVYVVTAGSGSVFLDGREYVVRPGSSVFVPGDVEHGVVNPGDEPLVIHYTFPVQSFADVEYHYDEVGPDGPPDRP